MFFIKDLERVVFVHPKHCGSLLRQTLIRQLHEEVEGKVNGSYGYVVTILDLQTVGDGVIQQGSGLIAFKIKYKAILFRLFKQEVVDGVVIAINQHGFQAEVGPVTVFVSNHSIPPSFKFDPISSSLTTADESVRIKKDDAVRIEILGVQITTTGISVVGNMRGNFLGKI